MAIMEQPKGRPAESPALVIFVVSDATGQTAEAMIRSALVQFRDAPAQIVNRGHMRTPQRVRAVVREAAERGALVIHTLVSTALRQLMLEEARKRGVDSMDLMGPVLERLATCLKLTPMEEPGLFRQLAEARSREIDAVEFAFHHDDGQRIEEIDRAEIVVVGVSRAMKTPTSLYLAYRGWFVANVPLIPEIDLPDELSALPSERVFCLDISEDRLLELRRARALSSKIPLEPYASPDHVRGELIYSQRLCRRRGWRMIDVTGKSVEEVCREIITIRAGEEPGRMPLW